MSQYTTQRKTLSATMNWGSLPTVTKSGIPNASSNKSLDSEVKVTSKVVKNMSDIKRYTPRAILKRWNTLGTCQPHNTPSETIIPKKKWNMYTWSK